MNTKLLRLTFAATVAALLAISSSGVAAAAGAAITIDIPVSATINGKDRDDKPISIDQVSGFRLGFITPWHVGVGVSRFNVTMANAALGGKPLTGGTETTDVLLSFNLGMLVVNLGYGVGKTKFDPDALTVVQTIPVAPFSLAVKETYKEGKATQFIAGLGVMLSESWDIHVTYHQYEITDFEVRADAGPFGVFHDKIDLTGTVTAAGIGYHF